MRIGIDNVSPGESTGTAGPGGMRDYLQSLLAGLSAAAPQHEFVLFTPAWADPLLDAYPENVRVVQATGVPVRRSLRALYQQTGLPAAIAAERLDVFFAPATIAPLPGRTPIVLSVQFLQFYTMPQAYGRARTAYLKLLLPLSLRRARQAIIFTEHAKLDLIQFTHTAPEKVIVIPHGLSSEVWAAARAASAPMPGPIEGRVGLELTGGRPYILYVSATYGYKNHLRLIRAFAALKRRTGLPHVLLLIGSEVHVSYAALRAEAEQTGVARDVIIAGRLEKAIPLYLDASLAAIPTLYETFGFPVLEAMATGCPVVTSNQGSMAELAGDAAVLVDPLDEVALADGMRRALTDEPLRRQLVARGRERAKGYTWQRAAAHTLGVLEAVARP